MFERDEYVHKSTFEKRDSRVGSLVRVAWGQHEIIRAKKVTRIVRTMRSLISLLVLAATLGAVNGLKVAGLGLQPRTQKVSMLAKGFGTPKAEPAKKKKPAVKSEGSKRRDKAAKDFDALKASGSPEYMVLIREAPSNAEPSKWYPVGGLAVPRSSSEDTALSLAIFNNEDDLLKGAFRSYPFLKKSTHKLEYGYRLKEFEDDPVKIADKDAKEQSDNPIMNWFNSLDNPLNDGSGWGNPLSRK